MQDNKSSYVKIGLNLTCFSGLTIQLMTFLALPSDNILIIPSWNDNHFTNAKYLLDINLKSERLIGLSTGGVPLVQ